tara:strand:+ start:280 stop:735 length:456 start_codon:yes stop_codon:yes gene_type:complete
VKDFTDIRENKVDSKVLAKLKKVKGLTKQQLQMLATMPVPVLTQIVNQLGMIVSQKEEVKEHKFTFSGHNSYVGHDHGQANELEEAPLIASDITILDGILKKIKDDIIKDKLKGKIEKSWPKMQTLARLAGYNISKKKQPKGKTYRWDLKK